MWSEASVPDVLVIGGGPAGSTVARVLARRGWHVVLVDRDRFPRPKACGECLNPGAVGVLARHGLLAEVERLRPAPIDGWRLRSERAGSVAGAAFGRPLRRGLGIGREALDSLLLLRARTAGVDVHEGFKVDRVRAAPSGGRPSVRIRASGGEEVPAPAWRSARIVVGADGLRSVAARCIGAHARRPRLRKVSLTARIRGVGPPRDRGSLVLGDHRVVGLAPVHADEPLWNATVVLRSRQSGRELAERDPEDVVREALASDDLGPAWTSPLEVLSPPLASGPFDWPTRRVSAPGVVLIGDAAGYFDPLTGQGIYRALRSAELAAEAIDSALRVLPSPPGLRGYERALRREFRAGRWIQKLVEGVVSRRVLRDPVLRRLAAAPETVRALIRVTGDAAPPRTLLDPRAWAPLLVGRAFNPSARSETMTDDLDRSDPC